jgi:hypothetical protein
MVGVAGGDEVPQAVRISEAARRMGMMNFFISFL